MDTEIDALVFRQDAVEECGAYVVLVEVEVEGGGHSEDEADGRGRCDG